jgi:hypothetical protein
MSLNELSEFKRDWFIKDQLGMYKTGSNNTVTGPSTEGYFGAVYVIRSGHRALCTHIGLASSLSSVTLPRIRTLDGRTRSGLQTGGALE